MSKKKSSPGKAPETKNDPPGYPLYKESEDIYNREQKIADINIDDGTIMKDKTSEETSETPAKSGADLDVPGSELDDTTEAAGNEDEENNFYSIGGDNHDNLEENGSEEPVEKI